jgi:anaerobic magnesium-protoporphyrin IX monomethyl ester cyclase
MSDQRKVRIIEPQGQPDRPLNAWISRWPLLGPITLATILDEGGHDAGVYNENVSGPLDANPEAYEDVCSADVVGISIMTPTAARGYRIADQIRRDAPGAKIVFGGVHATFRPAEALAHGDIVVCGEGEKVIEPIARGEVDDGIIQAPPLEDLDEIPTLNHFLMRDFDKLLGSCRRRELYELPVMTSRGCPYGCVYCCVTRMFGRKVRRQSVEKVHRDVLAHARQGFRFFFVYDDNFTSDRAWTKALLERLRPLRLRFNAQTRVDFHWTDPSRSARDDDMLRAMRRAGCDMLFIGYETIDEATAREWNKGYRGARSLEARLQEDTKILHDNGFWIHGMFVMGPQHTRKTAFGIVDFARRCEIETIQIGILAPYPGTPLFERLRPHLIFDRFPADWDYYDATHCVFNHGRVSPEELQQAVFDANCRFYRWGGWSPRAFRSMAARPMSATDKLVELVSGVRTAKTMMKKWRRETDAFLDVLRERGNH